MLFQCLGKDMAALAVGNKIERLGIGGVEHRLDRGAAGIGDRALGQPTMA